MIQVVYECAKTWPEQGPLRFNMPSIHCEVQVSPELARRRAKGYLTCEVAMVFRPGEPLLVWGEQPLWRMPVYLHLRGFGQVTLLGSIDVDAVTSKVIPLSSKQIETMQERAHAIALRLTPEAASNLIK